VTAIATSSNSVFTNLPAFTRGQVQLWNWYNQFLSGAGSWEQYFREALAGLAWTRGAMQLKVSETKDNDPSTLKTYTFEQAEIRFGRDPENEVVLGSKVAGKQHARVFVDGGQCFLEDLGSPLGTYLNGRRITSNQPHLITSQAQFVIFPYHFALDAQQNWVPETKATISAGRIEQVTWKSFSDSLPVGSIGYDVQVHPARGHFRLVLDHRFIEALMTRVLREDNLLGVTRTDRGLLEFLLLSVLQSAGRKLRFPFQFCLRGAEAAHEQMESGIEVVFSVGLTGLIGACRLFLPDSLIASMREMVPLPASALTDAIPFLLNVQQAELRLASTDIEAVEPGDVILFKSEPSLLLPAGPLIERCWSLNPTSDRPWRFQIERYFERSPFMDANAKPAESAPKEKAAFDTSSLPVRVQVLLAEVQLTVAELGHLSPGGVVELKASKSDPVKLLVNGAPYGAGDLVEIDGSLGVRLTSWGKT
jgi:type III secretion system YscQ/HrcQ family protein